MHSKSKKKRKVSKERKVQRKQGKVKDSATNGLKKEVSFAPPVTKEDQALMLAQEHETEMVAIRVEVQSYKCIFYVNLPVWWKHKYRFDFIFICIRTRSQT